MNEILPAHLNIGRVARWTEGARTELVVIASVPYMVENARCIIVDSLLGYKMIVRESELEMLPLPEEP